MRFPFFGAHDHAIKEAKRFETERRAELAEGIDPHLLDPKKKRAGLTATQRRSRYLRGARSTLTARQMRRIRHKSNRRKAQAKRRRRARTQG